MRDRRVNARDRRRAMMGGVALMASLVSAPIARAQQPSYTLAVVPQFQAVEITRVWQPIVERVAKETGITLVLKMSKDIPAFEDDIKAGTPDFAYMNPYHQLIAHKTQGYVPLLRDSTPLTGILVVRADDPIQSVAQLEGKTLAFPAPNAFGASLLIRGHLEERAKVHIMPFYAKTHTNAYRQTIVGRTAATGGLRATLEREPQEVRATLRVLMETPGSAPHPISAHPRVPESVRAAVVEQLLKLSRDPELQAHFKDIPMPQPVRADFDRDYLPLDKLKLERYAQ